MKGLLYRDLFSIWNGFRKNLILVLIIYVAMAIGMGMESILSVLIFLTGNYTVALLNFDENSKWDTYARTLPLSAGAQVAVRYLVSLLMITGGALASLALMLASGAVRGGLDLERLRIDLATVVVMVFLILAYEALALPLAYKFGAAKAQSWVLIAFVALFLGGFLLLNTLSVDLDFLDAPALAGILFGPVGAVLLLAFGLALLAVSWAVSTAIYKRKEF